MGSEIQETGSVKILNENERAIANRDRITGKEASAPPTRCVTIPMVVLDKPEPIKRRLHR